MDYESFGEHQWEDTGIFEFLRSLPAMIMQHPDTGFKTATETVQSYDATGEYDVPHILTWADTDRDLTAWTGNDIQRDAIAATYRMEEAVYRTKNKALIETWRRLQTSDHFYYMCTKWANDGDVHAYFSPYQSPYDAYIAFMNALSDLQLRVNQAVAAEEAREQKRAKRKAEQAAVKRPSPAVLPAKSAEAGLVASPPEATEQPQPSPRRWWEKLVQAIPFFNSSR
jgi:alpha-amylase